MVKVREVTVIDWMMVRLCLLVYQVKNEELRGTIVETVASVLNSWKEGSPSSWNEVKKRTETIKSYISGMDFELIILISSDYP